MFALAGHLGMTVAELGERMTSGELSEWIALSRIERSSSTSRSKIAGRSRNPFSIRASPR
jgi:hypothetical protein